MDIFIPTSKKKDAIVGPLSMVTWVTNEAQQVSKILCNGYHQTQDEWREPTSESYEGWNNYFGFDESCKWKYARFDKQGAGKNVGIRIIHPDDFYPAIRPTYEGLYKGGATISCPIQDISRHEAEMSDLGIESTIGIKEMEFESPSGETYISSEIVYKVPDNIFVLGVTRPEIFIPIGPVDEDIGLGGVAYSARCISETKNTIDFFEQVLGFEIRRDMKFDIDSRSAINLPEGTSERFIQGFSPGSSSGYVVFMDHGEETKYPEIDCYSAPYRGIVMWSFPTLNLDEIFERAVGFGVEILHSPNNYMSPTLAARRSFVLKDPDGFQIEIFENQSSI